MKRPITRWRERRGSAVLDLAITLGILLSLSFGTIEYGYFFFVKNTVQGAAREGARAGIVPGAVNGDVTTAISNTMTAAGLEDSGYTVRITDTSDVAVNVAGLPAGSPVKVTVECDWGAVGVRPLGLIGEDKKVVGMTVMRHE